MNKILIKIKTLSPLYMGTKKPYGHFLETHQYVPAGLVRGAVAGRLLNECPKPKYKLEHHACPAKQSCRFYRLFGDGSSSKILFGHCYPSDDDKISNLLPMTAKTCKYKPGFKSEDNKKRGDKNHGIRDTLISQLVYEELQQQEAFIPIIWQAHCECGNRLEPASGYYIVGSPNEYGKVEASTETFVHTAINRRRHTAEEEMLYSVEAVEADSNFAGILSTPDEHKSEIEEILQSVQRLGGGTSRGLGRVEITTQDWDESLDEPIELRIESFNQRLFKLWDIWVSLAQGDVLREPQGSYFTVGFQSDAILRAESGEFTVDLDAELLRRRLEQLSSQELPEIKKARSFVRANYVSGWSTAWGLPKEPELAIKAGSVFVYHTTQIDTLIEALGKLELEGIGQHIEEGFGRCVVCNPFHLEVKPV